MEPPTRVLPYSSGDATGIPLSALDPDTDGDGKIEEWEKEVYTRILAADTDNSGSFRCATFTTSFACCRTR